MGFFHAISPCDDITKAFKRLSWLHAEEDIQMSLPVICKLVSLVNSNKSGVDSAGLDELRLQLFKISSNNNFGELPPSERHIRRCSYGGWILGNSTSQEQVPPVESFGWTVQRESLSIHLPGNLLRPAAASLSVVSVARSVNLVFVVMLDWHV